MGAKKKSTPVETPGHVKLEEWTNEQGHTFRVGDEVLIDGDQDGRYVVRGFELVEANGLVSATLCGGPRGHAQYRTPGADRILPDLAGSGPASPSPAEDGSIDPPAGLRARREALKLSRGQLAEKVGVTVSAIASLEAGNNPRD